MGVLMVPALEPEGEEWPSLGPAVAGWMQEWLVHGPGDVRGEPYRLDEEKVGVLCRAYEVHPLPEDVHARKVALRRFDAGERWRRGMSPAGRRRFKRAGVSVRKGWAKTELAAAVAAAELHPDAPVRCVGWTLERGAYVPVGSGVFDPYVPMVAYTEEQSEELAYGALLVMLGEGPLADDFDLGVERILVIGDDGKARGKAVALAAAPDSRDGARTTFQVFDETHRQHSDRLLHAHETMLANVPKRLEADAWTLEVTTSYEPGKGSVAEGTHEYAKLVDEGRVEDRLIFYYHRQAGDHHDLSTRAGMEAAVLEASGPAAAFTDVDYIVSLGLDPQVDPRYWERVWLNRVVASSAQLYPMPTVDELALPRLDGEPLWLPEKRALVTLGFDGSKTRDSTGLVVADYETGRQAVLGHWEVPRDKSGRPVDGWEVPVDEVEAVVEDAFDRFDVVLFYADPWWWQGEVSRWVGRYGHRRIGKRRVQIVVPWETNRPRPMAQAVAAHLAAIRAGDWSYNGDPRLREHLANARRHDTNLTDEDGQPLPVMRKERPDSPDLIDLAMCSCLANEALRDARQLGARKRSRTLHVY